MESITDFVTWPMLLQFSILAAVSWAITNVITYVTGYRAKWVGLAVAVVLQTVVWWFASDKTAAAFVLAMINAFLIYIADTGGAAITGGLTRKPGTLANERRFLAPWW